MKSASLKITMTLLVCLTSLQTSANSEAEKLSAQILTPIQAERPRTDFVQPNFQQRLQQGQQQSLGGVAGGGGNTVGDQLFDDYINQDSVRLTKQQVSQLAEPLLKDLEGRVPGFAVDLREGLEKLHWYLEPKTLRQTGDCRNGGAVDAGSAQVVRACQSRFEVRIDKIWADANPQLLSHLILHELLVYQRLQKFPRSVTEEGLFAVSRELRNANAQSRLSNLELIDLIKQAGFGKYKYVDIVALREFYAAAGPRVAANAANKLFTMLILCEGYEPVRPKSFTRHVALCRYSHINPSDRRLIANVVKGKSIEQLVRRFAPKYTGLYREDYY